MRAVTLVTPNFDVYDDHHLAVIDALVILKDQKVRVFRTFTDGADGTKGVQFVTTNKEVDLELGRFHKKDLWHFGQFLEKRFKDLKVHELLIFKEKESDRGWHIVRSDSNDVTTFTLSPAH